MKEQQGSVNLSLQTSMEVLSKALLGDNVVEVQLKSWEAATAAVRCALQEGEYMQN